MLEGGEEVWDTVMLLSGSSSACKPYDFDIGIPSQLCENWVRLQSVRLSSNVPCIMSPVIYGGLITKVGKVVHLTYNIKHASRGEKLLE